jgi:hypothetical protein
VAGGVIFALIGLASFFVPAIVQIEDNGHSTADENVAPAEVELAVAGD